MLQLKYNIGKVLSIPLLPLMYFQGRRIRATVPKLPEAKQPSGLVSHRNSAHQLNVLALGESTIAGVGVERHEEGFTGALAAELAERLDVAISWQVLARSGFTAERVRKELLPQAEPANTDIVVIGLGANDAFKLHSPNRWAQDVEMLIQDLRSKFGDSTPLVFTNMPPIKEFPAFSGLIRLTVGNLVEMLGERLAEVAQNHPNVYYNDMVLTLEDWLSGDLQRSDFFSDGVHPSKLTYQLWGREIAKFIDQSDIVPSTQPA